ncbi:hypothetical protein TRVA0_008S00892 [Trichomonascus vanleenenianus]|uniref:Vta1p n=1 Tax=Trichomonascus vanleenenianus TaxID=2268995 RepID=UPI003EC9CDE5
MSTPEELRFLGPLLARAEEMKAHDPVISYFCKLHAAQQALGMKVHQQNEQAAEFVSHLLDEVEELKSGATSEMRGIIDDDTVGEAYVERFAMNIFAKADSEMRRKTGNPKVIASKLMAASVFLDVLSLFHELDTATTNKVRYAKFHAARILKAVKTGQDPFDYEFPEDEDETEGEEELVGGEEVKPEVIEGLTTTNDVTSRAASRSASPQLSASPSPGVVQQLPAHPSSFLTEDEPAQPSSFLTEDEPPVVLPQAPPVLPNPPARPPKGTPTRLIPGGPPLPRAPSADPNQPESRAEAGAPPPPQPHFAPHQQTPPQPHIPAPHVAHHPPPQSHHITQADVQNIMSETELVASAQKHAKYATSALNYDDMDTAIKELTTALQLLQSHQR